MTRPIRWYDYITVNIFHLALTFLSQTNGVVVPLLVQMFVGEETQGAFYGEFRLWTLMIALLSQSLFGIISDRSVSRWGRRRPFIVLSTFINLVFIGGVIYITTLADKASAAGVINLQGFYFLLIVSILLQISSNIGQAAQQGVIPDVIPPEKRGKFSGVKALLELPVPMALSFLSSMFLIKKGMIREGLFVAMGVFVVCMLLALLIPEKPSLEKKSMRWAPFFRLVLMTAVFTLVLVVMRWAVRLVTEAADSFGGMNAQLLVLGLAGLVGMGIAVGLGVWISVRISIGERAAARNPSFTWWVINRLAFLVGAMNLSTFVVYFMQLRMGYEGTSAAGPGAVLLLVVAGFIMISSIAAGFLADRFGRKLLIIVSGVMAAAGTLVAISVPNLYVIYTGGAIVGLATGLFFTANWALGTEIVPKEEAGRYLGISNLAGAGAGAVGAYIGGPIADHFTTTFPQANGIGYVLVFGIYAALFLLSILPALLVKETQPA